VIIAGLSQLRATQEAALHRHRRPLPLIRLRPRNRHHKGSEFVRIQFTIMIPISASKLHFQKPKHLTLRDGLGRRNRSHVILDCHENLRPQKGPHLSWANHAIAVSWKAIITLSENYVSEISDSVEGNAENSVLSREDTTEQGRHEGTNELDLRQSVG
jgi:hypothetical protein